MKKRNLSVIAFSSFNKQGDLVMIKNYKCYFVAVVVLALTLLLHNAKTMAAYKEGDVSNGGTITGTVKLIGDVPEAKTLKTDKDQKTCGHEGVKSEALIVSSGGAIKNAVVTITKIPNGKKFDRSANVVIDQKGCVFSPHVSVVPAGSTIELLNSDDVMHNLHSWSMKNTAFNEGVAGGGKLPKKFEFAETIKITCDVHKWMTSWLIVQDNPYYALTDESGSFEIEGVPAGTYKLQAWQESLGKTTQDVTVKAGASTTADFELQKKKKRGRKKKKKK